MLPEQTSSSVDDATSSRGSAHCQGDLHTTALAVRNARVGSLTRSEPGTATTSREPDLESKPTRLAQTPPLTSQFVFDKQCTRWPSPGLGR